VDPDVSTAATKTTRTLMAVVRNTTKKNTITANTTTKTATTTDSSNATISVMRNPTRPAATAAAIDSNRPKAPGMEVVVVAERATPARNDAKNTAAETTMMNAAQVTAGKRVASPLPCPEDTGPAARSNHMKLAATVMNVGKNQATSPLGAMAAVVARTTNPLLATVEGVGGQAMAAARRSQAMDLVEKSPTMYLAGLEVPGERSIRLAVGSEGEEVMSMDSASKGMVVGMSMGLEARRAKGMAVEVADTVMERVKVRARDMVVGMEGRGIEDIYRCVMLSDRGMSDGV
jgi:hypothetical protein